LNRSDVVPGHQKVGREGVAEGVAADLFGDSGVAYSFLDRAVDDGVVEVVAAGGPAAWVGAA